MTLAILILYACSADLSACRRERIELAGGYASAMQAVAVWAIEHDGYRVISWRVRG